MHQKDENGGISVQNPDKHVGRRVDYIGTMAALPFSKAVRRLNKKALRVRWQVQGERRTYSHHRSE